MIALTYAMSGVLLALSGWAFQQDLVTATTLTLCWMAVFFFASRCASSAYLTVSEVFPLEIRALAIALSTRSAPRSGRWGRPCSAC